MAEATNNISGSYLPPTTETQQRTNATTEQQQQQPRSQQQQQRSQQQQQQQIPPNIYISEPKIYTGPIEKHPLAHQSQIDLMNMVARLSHDNNLRIYQKGQDEILISQLKSIIYERNAKIEEMAGNDVSLRIFLCEKDKECNKLKKEKDDALAMVNDLRGKCDELVRKNEKLDKENQVKTSEIDRIDDENISLKKELNRINDELDKLKLENSKLIELKKKIESDSLEIAKKAELFVGKLEKNINLEKKKFNELDNEFDEAKVKLNNALSENAKLVALNRNYQSNSLKKMNEIKQEKKKFNALNNEFKAMKLKYNCVKDKFNKLNRKYNALNSKIISQKQQRKSSQEPISLNKSSNASKQQKQPRKSSQEPILLNEPSNASKQQKKIINKEYNRKAMDQDNMRESMHCFVCFDFLIEKLRNLF